MEKIRENHVERVVCDYARSKGWLVFKFASPGRRGVPDRIFIRSGYIFFIEFKALGKEPEGLQKATIDKIRCQGISVYVIDSIDDGINLINSFE